MLPSLLPALLPIPAAAVLVLTAAYHLVPLLALLPGQTPTLRSLLSLLPHPRRPKLLPREFFNLPPRPDDASSLRGGRTSLSAVLGLRGKLVLLLSTAGAVSLACGWAYATTNKSPVLLALSIIPLPSLNFLLGVFAARHHSTGIRQFQLPQIGFVSLCSSVAIIALAAAVPAHARAILIGMSTALVGGTALTPLGGAFKAYLNIPRKGALRLCSPSPELEHAEEKGEMREQDREEARDDSWLSSNPHTSTPLSDFSFSTEYHTPARSTSAAGTHVTPSSWLTSPDSAASTISEWDFTPSVRSLTPSIKSPQPAITRFRPSSPINAILDLPRPPSREQPAPAKASLSTVAERTFYSSNATPTPGSAIRSPGGSIVAAYSPDPFHPLPRAFESLRSYPLSPDQLASRTTLNQFATSSETFAFVPSERIASRQGSSTWTLQSYHSAQEEMKFKTPVRGERRAPPPPPMPTDMPLPPTPTVARSETLFDCPGKDSTELLMGEAERDWVEIGGVEGAEGWSRAGRGTGMLAIAGLLACYALYMPLVVIGETDTTIALYLISLLIPAPLIALTSYLFRYRPAPVSARRGKKGSVQSTSTYRSLALLTESQLSLPISISPKLTPPAPRRASMALNDRVARLIEPKPSISNFGYQHGLNGIDKRRHTVYGPYGHERDEQAAEKAMRRTLARRSGDMWLETGHAKTGGNVFARAAEMLKPLPALQVLDAPRPASIGSGVLTRLRGGVMSMRPNRLSHIRGGHEQYALGQFDDADAEARGYEEEEVRPSPIKINVESPSKWEHQQRRASALSEGEENGEGEAGVVEMATRGRMSASPTFFYGQPGAEEGQLDWLTAGVIQGLVPSIRIGSDVRIGTSAEDAYGECRAAESDQTEQTPKAKPRRQPIAAFSSSSAQTHGRSTSVDLSGLDTFTAAMSLRQRRAQSLHALASDVTPMQVASNPRHTIALNPDHDGHDLPPFPIDFPRPRERELSPVSERDEPSLSLSLRASRSLRELASLSRAAERSLQTPGKSMHGSDDSPYSQRMRELAGIALAAELTLRTPGNSTRSQLASRTRLRLESDLSGQSDIHSQAGEGSMISEDEVMAREMEMVMAMDTPTRAEFVISPMPTGSSLAAQTPRSAVGGSESRLRQTDNTSNTFGLRAKSSTTTMSSEYTYATASASASSCSAPTEDPPSPAPPVPEVPAYFRYPAVPPPVLSHPHPPPMPISAFVFPPNDLASGNGYHRPIEPHPSIQSLLPKKSSETIGSDVGSEASDVGLISPRVVIQEGQMSRREVRAVRALSERAGERQEAGGEGGGAGQGEVPQAALEKEGAAMQRPIEAGTTEERSEGSAKLSSSGVSKQMPKHGSMSEEPAPHPPLKDGAPSSMARDEPKGTASGRIVSAETALGPVNLSTSVMRSERPATRNPSPQKGSLAQRSQTSVPSPKQASLPKPLITTPKKSSNPPRPARTPASKRSTGPVWEETPVPGRWTKTSTGPDPLPQPTRGIKPLQLVASQNAKRLSLSNDESSQNQVGRRLSKDPSSQNQNLYQKHPLRRLSNDAAAQGMADVWKDVVRKSGTGVAGGMSSKASVGSGKENVAVVL